MSISSEIERLEGARNALAAAIEGKGVAVPSDTKIDGMAALVDQISVGGGGTNMEYKNVTLSLASGYNLEWIYSAVLGDDYPDNALTVGFELSNVPSTQGGGKMSVTGAIPLVKLTSGNFVGNTLIRASSPYSYPYEVYIRAYFAKSRKDIRLTFAFSEEAAAFLGDMTTFQPTVSYLVW